MDIRQITVDGTQQVPPADLPTALKQSDGVLWVDIPQHEPDAEHALRDVFGFHPQAVRDCFERNTTAKLHIYEDHAFLVLHLPALGEGGHVHSIELDVFVGPDYLVSVHGPLNPTLDAGVAVQETNAVAARIDEGRWRPENPDHLLHRIVTALNRRMNHDLAHLRHETWELEKQVTSGAPENPEDFLEEMFRVRLGLQAVRAIAALNREVFVRMDQVTRTPPSSRRRGPGAQELLRDSIDQLERVMESARIQLEYLQGVIEFYETRIGTKMTLAAERLAVIAAVTLPVTAVSSVLGMNVIVSQHTHWETLGVLLAIMLVMSLYLLWWARRQGWW